jgi:dihydroorotase-like cyclic amidohydrolase
MALSRLPDHQWPDPPRIPRRLDAIGKQKQQTVSPLQMLQNMRQRIMFFHMSRLGQQVHDDFRIRRRLKDVAVLFVFRAQELCIDEVAIMRHGHRPHQVFAEQRLRIAELGRARRRVSHVPDRRFSG